MSHALEMNTFGDSVNKREVSGEWRGWETVMLGHGQVRCKN